MAEMLLINPRRRAKPKARRASPKRRRRNPVKIFRKAPTVMARPSNPRRRRRNPIGAISRRRVGARRRRNPIGIGGVTVNSFIAMLKDAAVGGAGAIGMDMVWARVNGYLPATMQSVPGVLNTGTAVKAFATAVLGQVLSKATKGLSRKAASGALAVQARDAFAAVLPPGMMVAGRFGYASPASITQGTQRVGPVRRGVNGFGAYMQPGRTPLLNAYMKPGPTPLLNGFGRQSARTREGSVR